MLLHSSTPDYRVTSHTTFTLWGSEKRDLLCMQALQSNLLKDKYLPSSSAVLANEMSAASCLCFPWSVKARLLCREGACPLTVGHRQGLYPLFGLGKHSEGGRNENKIFRAVPGKIVTEKCSAYIHMQRFVSWPFEKLHVCFELSLICLLISSVLQLPSRYQCCLSATS